MLLQTFPHIVVQKSFNMGPTLVFSSLLLFLKDVFGRSDLGRKERERKEIERKVVFFFCLVGRKSWKGMVE